MKASGFYSISYALHPLFFPHFSPFGGVPQDVMHAEFSSGTANAELAQMLYLFISKERWFSVAELNHAIDEFPWDEELGVTKPPPVWDSIRVGKQGGLPADGAHLRYSGSQTMKFALASVRLLQPLVQNAAHPAWVSWKAHHAYLVQLLEHSFTLTSIANLDKAVQEHHKLCVPDSM